MTTKDEAQLKLREATQCPPPFPLPYSVKWWRFALFFIGKAAASWKGLDGVTKNVVCFSKGGDEQAQNKLNYVHFCTILTFQCDSLNYR